nr:MAG TPA: tail protein [Caudoviricetes sp.]
MNRDVKLENYLPPFMQKYKELQETFKSEDIEFRKIWEATDKTFSNRFIETADEYGLSRYEQMLGLHYTEDDNLESRRARIRNRWFNTMPYTMRGLILKLNVLCGESSFALCNDFNTGYELTIHTNIEDYGKVDELGQIISTMVPCNILVVSENSIRTEDGNLTNRIISTATSCLMIETSNYTQDTGISSDKVIDLKVFKEDNYKNATKDTVIDVSVPQNLKTVIIDTVTEFIMPTMYKDVHVEISEELSVSEQE